MDLAGNLPLLLGVVALILFQIFMNRKQKIEKTPPEIVRSLLAEIVQNLDIIEASTIKRKFPKFKTGSWLRNKRRLDFLDESLRTTLSDTFSLVEDMNQQIGAAKMNKSIGALYDVQTDKLQKPLTKSREGLEKWLEANAGGVEPPIKYPSVFDMFMGRG